MRARMLGIYAGDNVPRDVRNTLAARDCSRSINLNRIHACHMVNNHAYRTLITRGHWRTPLRFRESLSKVRQTGGAFLDTVRQQLSAMADRCLPLESRGRKLVEDDIRLCLLRNRIHFWCSF